MTMDLRKVALGAVFGAAVAVNATLQSLQDTGSFLIQGPSSSRSCSNPSPFTLAHPSVRPDKRAFNKSEANFQHEEASFFRAFLNEEIDNGGPFPASETDERLLTPFSAATTPSSETSAVLFQEDISGLESDSLEAHHRPRKLQVKRKSVEAFLKDEYNAECYAKGSDEEKSSTEDGDAEWDDSNASNIQTTSRRSVRRPMFKPPLPQMLHSEEGMSAMLQHTANSVLKTLNEAKEQREQMLENLKRLDLPGDQTSLHLMSRFIDALINVSDSLRIVHSALFPRTDVPQSRSQINIER